MKNTTELREELGQVFQDLKDKKITVKEAKSFCSLAIANIRSASVEADYNKFLGKVKEIQFLKTPK